MTTIPCSVDLFRVRPCKKVVADKEMLNGIGPISGEFFVFDLSPNITKQLGEIQFIKDFLAENGGVRVYRDGITASETTIGSALTCNA